jgi:hypothetical protein
MSVRLPPEPYPTALSGKRFCESVADPVGVADIFLFSDGSEEFLAMLHSTPQREMRADESLILTSIFRLIDVSRLFLLRVSALRSSHAATKPSLSPSSESMADFIMTYLVPGYCSVYSQFMPSMLTVMLLAHE